MHMKKLTVLVLLITGSIASAAPAPIQPLTDADVAAVVDTLKANPNAFKGPGSSTFWGLAVGLYGPKQRVASAYRIAKQNLTAFDPSTVDVRPLVEVIARGPSNLGDPYEIEHVVIVPKKGDPIQPKLEAPMARQLQSRLGDAGVQQDMLAYFSPDDIPAGDFDVVVVFSSGGKPTRSFKAGTRDKIE